MATIIVYQKRLLCVYNIFDKNSVVSVQVHNRIALLRVERGLTRKSLAAALGVNYQTVGYIERGDYNPSLELALRLAEFFQLPVEMIFSLEPFPSLSEQVAAMRKADAG